jgi:hypothetical protein
VVPRKAGKRRVTKESSRDGIACSLTHFSVFSQVDNLGCIEFLNRESQVRFLPGARSQNPRSAGIQRSAERLFRVTKGGLGPVTDASSSRSLADLDGGERASRAGRQAASPRTARVEANEAKRRGYKQLLDAYEATLSDEARAEGDRAPGNNGARMSS